MAQAKLVKGLLPLFASEHAQMKKDDTLLPINNMPLLATVILNYCCYIYIAINLKLI